MLDILDYFQFLSGHKSLPFFNFYSNIEWLPVRVNDIDKPKESDYV